MDCVEGTDDFLCPVPQHVGDRGPRSHGERQVEVGPAVAFTQRKRSHDGSGNDARVATSHRQHTVAHLLAIPDCEHHVLSLRAREARPQMLPATWKPGSGGRSPTLQRVANHHGPVQQGADSDDDGRSPTLQMPYAQQA
jgi:hypothetical protein